MKKNLISQDVQYECFWKEEERRNGGEKEGIKERKKR